MYHIYHQMVSRVPVCDNKASINHGMELVYSEVTVYAVVSNFNDNDNVTLV